MKKIKLIFVLFQFGCCFCFCFGSPIPMLRCLIARCGKSDVMRPIVQDNASFIFIRQTNHGFGLSIPKQRHTHISYPTHTHVFHVYRYFIWTRRWNLYETQRDRMKPRSIMME